MASSSESTARDRHDGAEDLLVLEPHPGRQAVEQRRLHQAAVAAAADQHARAAGHGVGDDGLDALGGGVVDHRADVGRLQPRIAVPQRADALREALEQLGVTLARHVHALDGDARLARGREAAGRAAVDREIEVRVGQDDGRGVRAELEHQPLQARLAGHHAAHRRRAGERDQRDAVVLRQGLRDARRAGQHAQRGGRPARRDRLGGQRQDGERGLLRRLDDDRAAGADGRAELVRRDQQREVERRDGGDHADRLGDGEADAAVGAGHGVERQDLADVARRRLGREAQRRRRPRHLEPHLADRLARLGQQQRRQVVRARLDAVGEIGEDRGAAGAGKVRGLLQRARGGGQGRLDVGGTGLGDHRRRAVVPREAHGRGRRAGGGAPGDHQRDGGLGSGRRRCGVGHRANLRPRRGVRRRCRNGRRWPASRRAARPPAPPRPAGRGGSRRRAARPRSPTRGRRRRAR